MRRSIWIGLAVGAVLVAAVIFGPGALTATGAEPAACGSCHVMEKNVNSFAKSSSKHAGVLTCGDCHNPDSLSDKYKTGFRHLTANLSENRPTELHLAGEARNIVIANCVRCHEGEEHTKQNGKSSCLNCHSNDPHGERGN